MGLHSPLISAMVKSTMVGEDVIEATPARASSDATDLDDDASPAQTKPAALSFPVAVKIPASVNININTVAQLALWSLIPRADPLPAIGTSVDLAAVVKEAYPLIHAADFLQMDDMLADIQDKLLAALRAFDDANQRFFPSHFPEQAEARAKLDGLVELLDLAHSFSLNAAFAAANKIVSKAVCSYGHSGARGSHLLSAYFNDTGTIVPDSKMAKLPPVARSEILAAALKSLGTL